MDFAKAKEVSPFLLWVYDLQAGLGLSKLGATDIAHETWPGLNEVFKQQRVQQAKKIKEVLRTDGGPYTYVPQHLPREIHEHYSTVVSRVWHRVASEQAQGIGENLSDLDFYFDVMSG